VVVGLCREARTFEGRALKKEVRRSEKRKTVFSSALAVGKQNGIPQNDYAQKKSGRD